VRHPDGSFRRWYCQESPEPWFEDFGEGRLTNGRADIRLDQDFAMMVKADDYLVFLTEVGDSGGLFLASRATTGFTVQSRAAGSTAGFHYRVVARRKDLTNGRLEKVTPPEENRPAPKVPDAAQFLTPPPSPLPTSDAPR
jgi:hypothetical protein